MKESLLRAARTAGPRVRVQVALNPAADSDVLAALLDGPYNPDVWLTVLQHVNATEQVVARALEHPADAGEYPDRWEEIQEQAMRTDHPPRDFLILMAYHGGPFACRMAINHPAFPIDDAAEDLLEPALTEHERQVAHSGGLLPQGGPFGWADAPWDIASELACHPDLPLRLLERCAVWPANQVRWHASRNPRYGDLDESVHLEAGLMGVEDPDAWMWHTQST